MRRVGLSARLGLTLSRPFARLDRPAFIIGCGRSGTTILGQVLARHPALTYLNERRDLWLDAVPAADVWTAEAPRRGGKLCLDAAAARGRAGRRLRAAFAAEARRSGRPRVLEKLPINSFRVPFIEAAFPGARFVHLVRNGVDVAYSIAERCRHAAWYGVGDYKWSRLLEYAESRPTTRGLGALCTDDRQRGLLEWRLSLEAALEGLSVVEPGHRLEIRYEDLVARPLDVLESIERLLELPPAAAPREFALEAVRSSRAAAAERPSPSSARTLAGDLLERLGYEVAR